MFQISSGAIFRTAMAVLIQNNPSVASVLGVINATFVRRANSRAETVPPLAANLSVPSKTTPGDKWGRAEPFGSSIDATQ
ncbi:MAG: hypothetical protein ACF8LL_07790, partial [Phycisphaerales bacterium]